MTLGSRHTLRWESFAKQRRELRTYLTRHKLRTCNHLTGCAVDIHVLGKEQAIRYACILLDIADESQEDFDELLIEQSAKSLWIHFAVRPFANRRRIRLMKG